ncbi:MAG: 16S rRNA (guanine(527)-N(7))-methyltransferase RsmG [Planctomycetota bacterium]|nr:16S rRNA (guanine(527)-N(7))-methyltransferase RsmG [Planctomycetota bacterium]
MRTEPHDDAKDPTEDGTAEEAAASEAADPEQEVAKAGEQAGDEEVEEVEPPPEFADLVVPSLDELRAALDWAFENEEDAGPDLLDTFARHARMVLEGAKRMNLTKIVEPREVAAKHYLDSWRSTRLLALMGKSLVDLGSGAGFPGIPIALSEPDTRVILIESKRKKADFLEECVTALEVKNAEVVCDRAEEHLARNRYDVVVMRAISSVRENVRLLRKVRHSHKDLIMLKGPSWSREVRAGEREAERLGFRLDTVWEHELPGGLGGRAVLVYRAPGSQGM